MLSRNGASAIGSQTYKPEHVEQLLRVLSRHVGPSSAINTVDLATEAGLPGRTVRAILSELDGIRFLVGQTPAGLFLCESPEQGAPMTEQLAKTAMAVAERITRRRRYRQPSLLGPEPMRRSA